MSERPPLSPADRALLEQYLDGVLAPAERAAFEARLEREPALRDELREREDLQGAIDASLARLYRYTPPKAGSMGATREGGPARPDSRPVRFTRRLWVLTGIAAAVVLASVVLMLYRPSAITYREPDALYAQYDAAGFRPAWKCESDQEFADATAFYLGSAVVVPLATPGVEVLGWSYADEFGKGTPISQQTLSLLTRVEGRNVLVLMDRADRDRTLRVARDSGLRLFRRVVNNLVLYEVTPLDAPRVLPAAIPATPTPRGSVREPPAHTPFDPERPSPNRPPPDDGD
jgi:hypothetical protein